MKKLALGVLAAVAALSAAGVATAQPYAYRHGGGYYDDRYDRHHYRGGDRRDWRWRDSDRDGVPDRREWNRDRDRDGRPDQYDRYDNRRHGRGWDRGYDRYDDRYGRGGYGYYR